MTRSFQNDERFNEMPGIFHFSASDVIALFGLKEDNRFGMRIYLGYHKTGKGYRAHRAIAVPTLESLGGTMHTDLIGIEVEGKTKTVIRELSFPCPDMCGNIADFASPLFSYEGAEIDPLRQKACEADETCNLARSSVRRFQADPWFIKNQFPGIFTFNYDDTRSLFEVHSDFGFRIYLAQAAEGDDYLRYSLYAVRTRLNENLMIYEDAIFGNGVVMRKAETSPLEAGGRNDNASPLFFYKGSQPDDRRLAACRDFFLQPHNVD